MKTLIILNDAPYGSERTYNGLRLAGSLARHGAELRMFQFLVGEPEGESEGQPGRGTVKRTYRFVLGDKFLHEQNTSTQASPPAVAAPPGRPSRRGRVVNLKASATSPWLRVDRRPYDS